MLSSVGIGTEAVWQALKANQCGIGPITSFDATDFNCRIAGEVKNFDPGQFIEKKELTDDLKAALRAAIAIRCCTSQPTANAVTTARPDKPFNSASAKMPGNKVDVPCVEGIPCGS